MFDFINQKVLESALRQIATFTASYLVASHILPEGSVQSYIGFIVALGSFGWSVFEGLKAYRNKQVVKSVANSDQAVKNAVVKTADEMPKINADDVLKTIMTGKK